MEDVLPPHSAAPRNLKGPPPSASANTSNGTPYTIALDSINENATPIPYASPLGMSTPAPSEQHGTERPGFREDMFSPGPPQASRPSSQGGNTNGTPYRGTHARRRSSLQYPVLPNDPSLQTLPPSSPSPVSGVSGGSGGIYARAALSHAFAAPGTEVLLWSYARLVGTLDIDESIVPPAEVDSLRAKLRAGGLGAVGGGRMDIAERAPAAIAPLNGGSPGIGLGILSSLFGGGGSPSVTTNGLGVGSSNALLNPQNGSSSPGYISSLFGGGSPALGRSRSLSISGRYGGGMSSGGGPFGGTAGEDPSLLPTLELQPSVLAVDLNLAPGETKSCEYRFI